MEKFNFKEVLRENLYNSKYPGDDKVRLVLNEGKTVLVEREIHEGVMDLLRGFTRTQPGWEKELERQIDTWLAKSKLDDGAKASLKKYYMKNLENLPAEFYKDEQNLKQVEDSLNAAEEGDVDKAEQELEDAVESAEDEKAEPEKGESLKAEKGDLVVVTSGDDQFLLRIGDIVGGEEEEESESRRGRLGSRGRRRAIRRFGSGSMRLGSGYSGSLGESILRLDEQEYMIDAGMLLNNGTEYLPEKAVDLTVDIARIATGEDIEKVKEKFPEEFEKFFGSQGKSSVKLKAGDIVVYKNKKGEEMFIKVLKDLLEAEGDNKRFFAGDQLNLKTGKFFARKATDSQQLPLSNVVRVATEEDIAKAKEKYPEQIAQLIGSQEEPTAAGEAEEGGAKKLVNKRAAIIAQALIDDKKITPALRTEFRNYFNSLKGVRIATPEDVDSIITFMKKVISNSKVRGQIARIAKADQSGNKNESKNYLKKVMTESIKAYTRHENNKQLKS